MDTTARVARINELARKKRTVGLSDEELREQQLLRAQYLRDFRRGMQQTLENVVVQEPDGTRRPLRRKDGPQ